MWRSDMQLATDLGYVHTTAADPGKGPGAPGPPPPLTFRLYFYFTFSFSHFLVTNNRRFREFK